jgi:hypothetical protein
VKRADPRRTVAAIVAIIACALAAVIVTAIVVVPAGRVGSQAGAATRPAALPKLKPILLSLAEASALVSADLKLTFEGNSLGQPAGADFAIDPAACTSVAFFGQAVTYRNAAWEVARTAQFAALPVVVSESVVLTASPEVATSFLNEQSRAWQQCLPVKYRFGTFSPNQFRVLDVQTGDDRIVAKTQADIADASVCGHVMAVKGAFVVEGVTCGYPPYDTGALVDLILKRIPD